MAYQIAATAVTLNGLFKCNPSNTVAAFYSISTDSVLAQFLCISTQALRAERQSARM